MEHRESKSLQRKWLKYRHRLRFSIFRRDGFRCRYCGRSVQDGAQLELEHIVPISKGGDYSPSNLTTSCHTCNSGKDNATLSPTETELLKSPAFLFADWPVVGWKAVTV